MIIEHKLISGEYKHAEAREILLSLIDSKIKFHNLNAFSTEERFGAKDKESSKRLLELKSMRAEIVALLKASEPGDFSYKISSSIAIEVVPKHTSGKI